MATLRWLVAALLALALMGCHPADEHESYGYVEVDFGTGYAYYSSSGWYYSASSTNLVVDAEVISYGDAVIVEEFWTVIEYPVYAPSLSHPYSRSTTMTFPTTGTYVLDYHVDYEVDGVIHHSTHRLEVDVLPTSYG